MMVASRVLSHEIAWIICPNSLLENQDADCGECAGAMPENSGSRDSRLLVMRPFARDGALRKIED
jgi:hypothetical protein